MIWLRFARARRFYAVCMFPLKDDLQPPRHSPAVMALVVLNSVVFLLEMLSGPEATALILAFANVPLRFLRPQPLDWLTLVTSCFLHGSLLHLLGNMWFLYIFGKAVERRMGTAGFAIFYLSCGVLAGLVHILFNPISPTPAVGASGAIAGVLAAYMFLFPKARVATLFVLGFFIRILEVPARLLIGVWFLGQTLAAVQGSPDEIAYWAHVGGFLAGLALLPLFSRRPANAL
jgi:membrane associated rhomboid family serine protease